MDEDAGYREPPPAANPLGGAFGVDYYDLEAARKALKGEQAAYDKGIVRQDVTLKHMREHVAILEAMTPEERYAKSYAGVMERNSRRENEE